MPLGPVSSTPGKARVSAGGGAGAAGMWWWGLEAGLGLAVPGVHVSLGNRAVPMDPDSCGRGPRVCASQWEQEWVGGSGANSRWAHAHKVEVDVAGSSSLALTTLDPGTEAHTELWLQQLQCMGK